MRKVKWDPTKAELCLLIIEDDATRAEVFQHWLRYMDTTFNLRMVWVKSSWSAKHVLDRDRGRYYAGIVLGTTITPQSGQSSAREVVEKLIEVTATDVANQASHRGYCAQGSARGDGF